MKGLLTKDFLTVKKKYGIARLVRVTPKFCVKSIERRNRAKFICRRQRLDRLPPISTT